MSLHEVQAWIIWDDGSPTIPSSHLHASFYGTTLPFFTGSFGSMSTDLWCNWDFTEELYRGMDEWMDNIMNDFIPLPVPRESDACNDMYVYCD